MHRTIKPQILASFGDVALVIGDKFEKYLEAVLRVLKQAMQLSIHQAQSAGGWAGVTGDVCVGGGGVGGGGVAREGAEAGDVIQI